MTSTGIVDTDPVVRSRDRRGIAPLDRIVEHWATEPESVTQHLPGHYIGWGEPFCFACGWMPPVIIRSADCSWNPASKWLDRAHLKDHCRGGSGEPDNLVPLCHLCHDNMPSFDNRDKAWQWVADEPRCESSWQTWTDITLHERRNRVTRSTTLTRSRMKYLEYQRDPEAFAARYAQPKAAVAQ